VCRHSLRKQSVLVGSTNFSKEEGVEGIVRTFWGALGFILPKPPSLQHDVLSTLYALISARLVWATSPDRTRKPPIRCLLYQPNKATNPDASIV